jgi:hypothetical protein
LFQLLDEGITSRPTCKGDYRFWSWCGSIKYKSRRRSVDFISPKSRIFVTARDWTRNTVLSGTVIQGFVLLLLPGFWYHSDVDTKDPTQLQYKVYSKLQTDVTPVIGKLSDVDLLEILSCRVILRFGITKELTVSDSPWPGVFLHCPI